MAAFCVASIVPAVTGTVAAVPILLKVASEGLPILSGDKKSPAVCKTLCIPVGGPVNLGGFINSPPPMVKPETAADTGFIL